MKFTIPQSTLSAKLAQLIKLVPSNPSHPILGNILVQNDFKKQTIAMSVFDLTTGLKLIFPAEVAATDELTFPAQMLNELVTKLPSKDILVTTEGNNIELKCGTGKYKIQGLSAEDFPEFPEVTATPIAIPSTELIKGLSSTLFSSSTDESKQVLTGLHISASDKGLEFATTDGHRLSIATNADLELAETVDATISAKALRRLLSLIAGAKGDIELLLDRNQAVFKLPEAILTTRLLDGQYPAYHQLMPKVFKRTLLCSRTDLVAACDRIGVIAVKKNNIIVMSCTEDSVTISAEAADVGNGSESLDALLTGGDINIGFNVKYVLEALRNMNSEQVQILINEPTMPAVFCPLSEDKFQHLVMPIQIRS